MSQEMYGQKMKIEIFHYSHASVCCLKVDTQTTRPSTHQEDEIITPRSIELIDNVIPLRPWRASIEPTVSPSSENTVILQNVEHTGELRKDASPVSILEQ